MKITISVGGKFHAFHLALELEKRGYLSQLYTSYPWFKMRGCGISRQKVSCLSEKEILERTLGRIPYIKNRCSINILAANLFDRLVSRRIKPCDLFIGWSGFSLFTMRRIKSDFQAVCVLERGSTHIESQKGFLRQECGMSGVKLNMPSLEMVNKELEEYKIADYIAVPSFFARKSFLEKGFDERKIIQVPLGVDTGGFRPCKKNDLAFRIICVGVSMLKGIHYILRAIDELKIEDIELWLIGQASKDIEPFLKKYSGKFKYFGRVPHQKLYKYYSQGSVSILFSLDDGFGMSVLEAMACGVPVICSDRTGASDVIRDGIDGFIVKARDVDALKERILYLYNNPGKCREMGRNALERAKTDFTWGQYGEKITKAYLHAGRQARGKT